MRTTPTCLPCLLERAAYEATVSAPPDADAAVLAERRAEAVAAARRVLTAEVDLAVPPINTDMATRLHRAVHAAIGDEDPYAALKAHANAVAMELRPQLAAWAEAPADPAQRLGRLMRLAIAGNVVDFGIAGSADPSELATTVLAASDHPLEHDPAGAVLAHLAALPPDAEVLLLTDNCGEVALDVPLVRFIEQLGHRVTAFAKPAPILTDATVEEALSVGLGEVASGGVHPLGGNSVGLIADEQPPELQHRLREAGLIIAKGMGHWESLSDHPWWGPRLHLLKIKCGPVSASLGAPEGTHVARLIIPEHGARGTPLPLAASAHPQ